MIAGTATAVSNRVSRRQANKWAAQEAPPEPQAPPAPAPAPAAPAAGGGGLTQDRINELKQLGELKEQGILTDEEFATQKAKILGE